MKLGQNKKTGHLAGLLYVLLALTGMFGILYVPTQLIVGDDPVQTALNIQNNEFLYRAGIMAQLACQTLFVYLVLTLYQLFKKVNKTYTIQMVTLVVVSIPISFTIMAFQVAGLVMSNEPEYLSSFDSEQLNALSLMFYKLYQQGVIIAQIFWGLWLIPFGLLVYQSKFLPKLIGIFLVAGGVGYVIASTRILLFPDVSDLVDQIATIPSALGEFSAMLWLLIKGIKENKN